VLGCTAADVTAAWEYFRRADLHKLSAVDATSFVIMARHGISTAFAFDHHFATAGFRLV
jgi:predicted nucleic acid-binding protein